MAHSTVRSTLMASLRCYDTASLQPVMAALKGLGDRGG